MKFDNPHIGPNVPRMGNAFTRWLGDMILKLMGWKVAGKLANEKQAVLIGGPHTSNQDLFLALGCALSVGLKFSWMMKKEAFFWPLGGLWKALGGIPIDRKAKLDIVGQMKEFLASQDKVWLGLTPEGTRSKVKRYKTGYLRIAMGTHTPVFIVGVDGRGKTVTLDKIWELTGDIEADNAAIKSYIETTYSGVNPEKV